MDDASYIRKTTLAKRAAIDPDIRLTEAVNISFTLSDIISKKGRGKPVLCYYPLLDEPDLRDLYEELLGDGVRLFFPVSGRDEIEFFEVFSMSDFSEGAFGIMEPSLLDYPFKGLEKRPAVCIVPGVSFDRDCNRIGFGKGYYDRFLGRYPDIIYKIGVCFQTCIYEDELPVFSHDVPMDIVVTGENTYLRCR